MISMLQSWQGQVELNGVLYASIRDINPDMLGNGEICIKLLPKVVSPSKSPDKGQMQGADKPVDNAAVAHKEIRITVKQYMTKKAEPNFDFMAKWNNDNPMPLRTMQGWVEKETRGMQYMHLHGVGQQEVTCMRCGRRLTHPVSRHYGIGPECMQKVGIVADIEDVESIKEQLVKVEWTGWVIKSAITDQEEV